MGHAFRKRKPYIICINRMLYNCFREVNKRANDGQILYDIFIFVSVVLFLFFFLFVFCLKLNADLELLLVRVFFGGIITVLKCLSLTLFAICMVSQA